MKNVLRYFRTRFVIFCQCFWFNETIFHVKLSLSSGINSGEPSFWFNVTFVWNAISFCHSFGVHCKNKTLYPENYTPFEEKEVLFMFLFVEKLFVFRVILNPPEVYFIESTGMGSYFYGLGLDFIPVVECCIIHTLYFRFCQHKRKHRSYSARNQVCQKHSIP